jgi:hypothetical protein
MFSLANQAAKLTSVNPRAEIHGNDHVMAADLKFEIKVSNDVLSEFDPSLKSSLYKKADGPQGELIHEAGHLPCLKYPLMGPVKWGQEYSGYETVIHYGVSGAQDIHLIDCEVDNFRFDCQDGGTVVVSFRVIAHPEPTELGRLCEMIQQEVEMSLIEPDADNGGFGMLEAA